MKNGDYPSEKTSVQDCSAIRSCPFHIVPKLFDENLFTVVRLPDNILYLLSLFCGFKMLHEGEPWRNNKVISV